MASVPETMTAVEITTPGRTGGAEGEDACRRRSRAPGQVLVKVAAAGVNRPDVQQRIGAYPPPPGHSPLPGLEVAGEVAAIGARRDALEGRRQGVRARQRRRLRGILHRRGAGGAADSRRARHGPGRRPCRRPSSRCGTTCSSAGGLKAGEWFLVHGGTSGIGTTAIQLAKAFGAKVIATAGSADKCKACLDLGADRAINYKTRGLRGGVQGGDRRQGRQRHPRHGRRRLHRQEHHRRGRGWPHRADRDARRRRRQDQHRRA